MAQQLADRRDVDFVLYEQLEIENMFGYPKYSNFNKKMFDLIIGEARKMSLKEILPTNAEEDEQGVFFNGGKVTVPECFRRPYKLLLEGEWTSMTESPELGGQGLPNMINIASLEYIWGANYCLANYATMGHGTGKMIELFGTPAQKDLFVKKLYTGEWGGNHAFNGTRSRIRCRRHDNISPKKSGWNLYLKRQ
jgi:alkylation response protein AidB-like acyl-CoA dehydrogenase